MELIDDIRSGGTPTFDAMVSALTDQFSLLLRLADTPQEPEWHGEGDVHVHTRMVVEELYEAMDGHDRPLSADERLTLVFGAVFHDVAKPLTTRERHTRGKLRIVAPRHADRGRSYLAYRLKGLGLSWDLVDAIMALVGHHHDPKRLLRKDRGIERYRRLARLASPELLYLLEVADIRGRICDDKQEQLERLELFRLQCEEFDVWDVDDPYASWRVRLDDALQDHAPRTRDFVYGAALRAHEAGEIVMPAEEVARSYGYRDDYSHLVVLCGPSGCGKSTWIAEHAADYDVVSLDDLREELTGDAADQSRNGEVRQLSKERLKESLRANRDVVWDATSLRRDFRSRPIRLGYDYGAFVTLIVFQPARETARRRNASRRRSVPDEVLDRQFESAEFPYRDEAHEVLYVRD